MITADLKLVVQMGDLHAYHSPIPREVYEANFRLLRDTKVSLLGNSAKHAFAARGDASLYLKEAGRALAAERGVDGDGGATALLADLRRLTVILLPGPKGWEMTPVEVALSSNRINEDDWADAEAAIVFFTSWVAGTPKREKDATAQFAASLIGGSTTSSPAMEWIASLPTSTGKGTGAPKAGSSVPS